MVDDSLSVSEKLLLAAFRLEEGGKRPFSAEDLVVSAWQNFPDTFGLAGHRDEMGKLLYPDSNRVFAEIMGSKPIRKRGLLKKVGKKMYQLTEAGRDHSRLLLHRGPGTSRTEKIALSRETSEELKKLMSSKVMDKFKDKRLEEITFYDACSFWGISPRSSAIELEGRIANFEKVVDTAKKISKRKPVTFEHSGDVFGETDLALVLQAHRALLQKFQNELDIIKQRRDERA